MVEHIFESDEVVTSATVYYDTYVHGIFWKTNKNTYGPYHSTAIARATDCGDNVFLAYFSGRCGSIIDDLTLHFLSY